MEGKKKIITVTVRDKIATGDGSKIVCGNSDYIVHFDLDEEWSAYEAKTARFKWGGKFEDIVFKGNECPLPVLKNTLGLKVGIFAGDLRSTTDAVFDCNLSTLCESGAPADPSPDVYAQLMELINAGVNPEQVEAAVLKYLDENPITSDYTLPVANAATLGGVKPVAATAEMTQPVGVDADGALFTAHSAEEWKTLLDIVTTEETMEISQTFDKVKSIKAFIITPPSGKANPTYLWVRWRVPGDVDFSQVNMPVNLPNKDLVMSAVVNMDILTSGFARFQFGYSGGTDVNNILTKPNMFNGGAGAFTDIAFEPQHMYTSSDTSEITGFDGVSFKSFASGNPFPIGTIVRIIGR